MSSKKEDKKVKAAGKRPLVPKRRFPEFRDEGEWETYLLNQVILEISNGLTLDQSSEASGFKVTRIETISNNCIDESKVGYVETDQDISRYRLNIGDILFSNINSVSHIGRVVIVDRDYNLYHGMNLLRLVVDPDRNTAEFIFYLLNTDSVKSSIKSRANKAVNQASINQTELGRTSITIPQRVEQQKIADCLSSLDELISLEAQRLDALKAHKKGMMQRLFPGEGETVPRLRFPEFRDAGEWEVKTLGDACDMQAGKFVQASELKDYSDNTLYPCYGGNGLRGYTKTYTHEGLYALIGRQGALCGNVTIASGRFHATEHALVTTPKHGVDNTWLYFELLFLNLNQYATGQAQPGLSVENLERVEIKMPSNIDEQQRIAAALSSLDELIATQTDRLAALKIHKKGLMQGLFPVLDETESQGL